MLVSVAKGLTRHVLFKGFKELEITEHSPATQTCDWLWCYPSYTPSLNVQRCLCIWSP